MYAIFEDGSRQYRAEEGGTVVIDYREVELGATIELTNVLLIENNGDAKIGLPTLVGAKIIGEVVDFPSTKTVAQLFRRRKTIRKLRGHRQPFIRVKITQIVG